MGSEQRMREIDAAIARAKAAERERLKAIAAVYRVADDTVVITLATGVVQRLTALSVPAG